MSQRAWIAVIIACVALGFSLAAFSMSFVALQGVLHG